MANVSNDTLIREVDEELRRDRMRKLWRNFGPFVIGAAVLVVLVVAGYEGWNWWQKTNSSKYSDQFYAATEVAAGKDLTAAKKALDDVIAGGGGYAMLAQFREAALLSANGKTDEAVAAYDALATNQSNTHIRNLALVLGANLLIDKGDVAAVHQRVAGLLGPDAPLRNAAREILGLTQYKAGDLNTAIATLQQVAGDPAASRDVRARVSVYISQIAAEGGKTKEQLAQAAAPAATTAPATIAAPATPATTTPATPAAATPAPAADLSMAPATDASSALDAGALLNMAAPAVDGTAPGVDADTSLDVTAPAGVTPALPETASSAASSAPAN